MLSFEDGTALTVRIFLQAAPATLTDGGGQCNVGELSCCMFSPDIPCLASSFTILPGNQVQENSESLVGIVSGPVGGMLPLMGMDCSPLSSEGGMASNSCAAQPVCCQKNEMVCSLPVFTFFLASGHVLSTDFHGQCLQLRPYEPLELRCPHHKDHT